MPYVCKIVDILNIFFVSWYYYFAATEIKLRRNYNSYMYDKVHQLLCLQQRQLSTITCISRIVPIWPHWFNTQIPDQNGRHCAVDIFKWIFFSNNLCILIIVSLKFGTYQPIDNKSSSVHDRHRAGDKAIAQIDNYTDDPVLFRICASLRLDNMIWRWPCPNFYGASLNDAL